MDSKFNAPPPGSAAWWKQRYHQREIPWDSGIVPPEVYELVDQGLLQGPGFALDLGCGTGTNTTFLAQLGFTAVGIDLALLALTLARRKALADDLPALFCLGDVANLGFLSLQAHFALDVGCLHSLPPERRSRYASSLAERLLPGALYLMYGFDARIAGDGRPMGFEAGEVAARFAPGFSVRWIRPSFQDEHPVAWYLLERLAS
jgi:SAM-dependent methyltransferase